MSDHRTSEAVIEPQDFARRVIQPADFMADTEAFVDVRLPRSRGKASYSFIGPGVSQNTDQTVNLTEPHGFQIGAASMGHGVVNNQHLHFTAEVLICTRGQWRVNIGEHAEQQLEISPGTVFSAPNWVFRGFENIGPDDGWLFTVLGGDDTGGIIWAPDVLRDAAQTGLYLKADYSLLDASNGEPPEDVILPLDPELLSGVDDYSDDELAARTVAKEDLQWSASALLSSVLSGHDTALAPVIGYGLTEDRHHRAPIATPHGFSVEWLSIAPGASTGIHRHGHSQVVLIDEGHWEIAVNRGDDAISASPAEGSVVSIPPGVWRNLRNCGTSQALAVVVCATDQRAGIEWDPDIVTAAELCGWSHDAAGYLAPTALLGRPPK
ncbi:cupin domain-containing protein [Candidatus Poriferisocius sp.]|uniref:cupin domain-containing protein n=1 Tax=Candidatus Poriferisocius sp. TaxID=3101276 RepID=UPI003B5B693A